RAPGLAARLHPALPPVRGALYQRRQAAERQQRRDRGGGEAGGQQLVLGGRDHQSGEREAGGTDRDDVLAPDGAELDRGGAEQLRRLGAARPQERGQREGERGQRPERG